MPFVYHILALLKQTNKQNRRDFKMELELPSQRNRLACLRPHTCGMFKRDKITFGLGLIAALDLRQVFLKDNRKADIITTVLNIKNTLTYN